MTETLTESMRRFANVLKEGQVTNELTRLFSLTDEANPQSRAQAVAQKLQGTIGKHDSGHEDVYMVSITPEFLRDVVLELESMMQRRKENHSPYRGIDGEDVEEAIANLLYDGSFDASREHEYEAEQDAFASRIVPAFGFEYEPRWDGNQPDRGTDEEQWQSYKEDELTKDR